MSRLTDHERHLAEHERERRLSGWAVVFTPPKDWQGSEPVRPCEDQVHAESVRDTFPTKYLPVHAARLVDGQWKQVGEVRTA